MQSNSLQEKVALVVGAGRPLGRIAALGLARAGAKLALHDLTPVLLDETAEMVIKLGAECRTYTGDIGKGLPSRALISDVLDDWKRLDILVTGLHAAPPSGLFDLDEWDWTRTLELNLTGPFLLVQAAVGVMEQQGGGSLIFLQADSGRTLTPALTASQAGLVGLARAAAIELFPYNIYSFTIATGDVSGWDHITGTSQTVVDLQEMIVHLCTPTYASLSGQVIFPGGKR